MNYLHHWWRTVLKTVKLLCLSTLLPSAVGRYQYATSDDHWCCALPRPRVGVQLLPTYSIKRSTKNSITFIKWLIVSVLFQYHESVLFQYHEQNDKTQCFTGLYNSRSLNRTQLTQTCTHILVSRQHRPCHLTCFLIADTSIIRFYLICKTYK